MESEKRKFTVELERNLSEAFTALVDEHGWKKTRAIRGAVKAFLAFPTGLQVKIMSANNTVDVYTILVEGLLEAELAKELDKLGPDKKEFLALVRQAKAKVSRKK